MSGASFTFNLPRIPISLTGSVSEDAFSALLRGIADENQRTNGRIGELEGKTAELERRADNIAVKYVLRCQYEFQISSLNTQVDSLAEMNSALTKRLDEAERMIAVLGLALTPS